MGSGSYFDFFWDRAAGLLIIDVARASRTTAALLGFRINAASPDEREGPAYAVIPLPAAERLRISIQPIIDREASYEPDEALFDQVELATGETTSAPAERDYWSIVLDRQAELEIRRRDEPATAPQISALYLSERRGAVIHPARSLSQASAGYRLRAEALHRFDPVAREDFYEITVVPSPDVPLLIPLEIHLDTVLAATEACQYLQKGTQYRQEWSLNRQDCVLRPGDEECRLTIPGPEVDYQGERCQGHALGFLDRVLLWTTPPCLMEFVTHDQETSEPQTDGLLLLVSLGGADLQQDTGALRQIMLDLLRRKDEPVQDHWYQHAPNLARHLGQRTAADVSAIAEFAYATCIQDILINAGGAGGGRLRPAAFADYARGASLFELLRNGRFADAAARLRHSGRGLVAGDGPAAFLFDLAAGLLRSQNGPPEEADAARTGADGEILEMWLEAFRDLPWDLVELSLYPNLADAARLGVLPDQRNYGGFAYDFFDHRETAERYQGARARLEAWGASGAADLPPLVSLAGLQRAADGARQAERELVEAIRQSGTTVGIKAELAIVSGMLPPFEQVPEPSGETARTAAILFQERLTRQTGSDIGGNMARFLVALIADDCRVIDRAVAAYGLGNPAVRDLNESPARAAMQEPPRPAYRAFPARMEPDIETWTKQISQHPIVDSWREQILMQIS